MKAAKPSSALESVHIRRAVSADVDALAALINIAFRVELPFIEGDRINPGGVREYMKKGEFLIAEDSAGLAGCVYVEVRGNRGYLGLLGVEPRRQGTGLGRKLMNDAEDFFCTAN
jgi:N-acetylglutamate synthase-like GNAT family acetyltransferase